MPGEQNPDDYYHYYLAAQRRVEHWVKKTDEELHELQGLTAHVPLSSGRQGTTEMVQTATPTASQRADRRQKQERTSSSKHRTEDRSRSRSSSGSKKTRALPTGEYTKPSSRDLRRDLTRKAHYDGHHITISSYLPYGVFPVVYAMTRSFGLSAVVAVLLLAVCFSIDYDTQIQTQGTISRKRAQTN